MFSPAHVFYPANDTYTDGTVSTYRRVTRATERDVRLVRAAGAMGDLGNRILRGV